MDEKTNKNWIRIVSGRIWGVIEAYQDIAKRLGLVPDSGNHSRGNIDEQIAATLGEIENELAREKTAFNQ